MNEDGSGKHYARGLIWLGSVFMLAGVLPVWLPLKNPEELHAPYWVKAGVGGMFFSAGILTGSMDVIFNPIREKTWFAWIQGLALLSIPLSLLAVLNWVAFGPGEREFSVSISVPFLSAYFPRSNEWLGRLFFGIPALFGDILAVGVVFKLIADWINEDGGPWRW